MSTTTHGGAPIIITATVGVVLGATALWVALTNRRLILELDDIIAEDLLDLRTLPYEVDALRRTVEATVPTSTTTLVPLLPGDDGDEAAESFARDWDYLTGGLDLPGQLPIDDMRGGQ